MSHKGEKINVWPGYVAAMACLLQSLVLVCGVFALIILALNSEHHKSALVKAPKKLDSLGILSKTDLLRLKFIGRDWTLDADTENYLTEFVKKVERSETQTKFVLWINVDKDADPVGARLAYLRVLMVRNVIAKNSKRPGSYEYRLFNLSDSNYSDSILHIGTAVSSDN